MSDVIKKHWRMEVTEEDIKRARIGDSYNCVVTRTVARNIPECTHIEADIQTVRFSVGEWRYVYLTPRAVQEYIVDFDDEIAPAPFKFTLSNPQIIPRRLRGKKVDIGEARRKIEKATGRKNRSKTPPRAQMKKQELKSGKAARLHNRSKKRTYGMRELRINRKEK